MPDTKQRSSQNPADGRIDSSWDKEFSAITSQLGDLESNPDDMSAFQADYDNKNGAPSEDEEVAVRRAKSRNQDAVKNGEEAGDPTSRVSHVSHVKPQSVAKNQGSNFVSFIKRNKTIITLISTVGITGTIMSGFFGPASMIVNLMQNFTVTNDTTSTSLQRRFIKNLKNASGTNPVCMSSKLTINCSMGVLSKKSLRALEAKGVTAYADKAKINSKGIGYIDKQPTHFEIDLKDGSKPKMIAVSDLEGFLARPENKKFAAAILGIHGAFNLRVRNFMGRYIADRFFNKFSLARSGGLAAMSSELGAKLEARLAAWRDKLPGAEKIADAKAAVMEKLDTHMGKLKKGGAAYLVAVSSCVVVKAPAIIAAAVAAVQLAQILPIVSELVLSPGSMAMNAGNGSGFTADGMDTVGTALTQQSPRESDGKMSSALDSPYLLAAMGVNTARTPPSAKFSPGFGLLTNPIVKTSQAVEKQSEPLCNAMLSPLAMYTAMGADIAVTVAASSTIVLGLAKVAISWIVSEAVVGIVKAIFGGAVEGLLKDLATNKDIPQAKGQDLGDVVGIGAMAFFSSAGMARNMPVLSKKTIASADRVQQLALQDERDMAVATLSPFDTSSQYTFLGSIVHNMQFAMLSSGHYNNTLFSLASNLVNLPSMAFAIASPKVSAGNSSLATRCDYAAEWGMATNDDATTPAINAAGLPCTGLTEDQANMDPESALSLIKNEGWLNEDVAISMSDSITDLVTNGFIRPDTPLADAITTCSDASTGDYLFNASGCIPQEGDSDSASKIADINTPCTTTTDPDTGESSKTCADPDTPGETMFSATKNALSMIAINVFLADYQITKLLQGEDEETPGGSASGSGSGEVINGLSWIVDKKWYDNPATHDALMKGHQANSGWYFKYPDGKRYAMDMSPSNFKGAPVYALADGVVHIYAGDRNNAFYIESNINGKVLRSLYAHGQNLVVKDGDTVKAGQQVMQVGDTGNSTVPHIHWEVQYDSKPVCGGDILNNLATGTAVDMGALTSKATENCLGRI